MYVKVTNNSVEKYPYSIAELKIDNPNTSFPDVISSELLAEWNVFSVRTTHQPDHNFRTQNVKEISPQLIDGEWTQSWIVEDASESEINQRRLDAENNIRSERNQKLAETDWIVTKSLELNQLIPENYVSYRQALRDITQQETFPWHVDWPIL